MPPTPQQQALLAGFAERLDAAPRGGRATIVAEACAALGVAAQTAHRWLAPHRGTARKRRADSGATALTRAEGEQIVAVLTARPRLNGKRIVTLVDAVAWLRTQGTILAGRIDPETGEVFHLSESAIARALNRHGLHPDRISAPTPHQPLSSPHPNHTWQVDASVCVVFYLPGGGNALIDAKAAVHYKNKPENLKAVEAFRVIRYVATDHCSGVVRVRYYPHAESGEHTVRFLAWLMAPKGEATDPFHGAPLNVMVDPGATAAGLVKRFCRRLGVNLIVNKPGNPRAKGQVEQANNLWEIKFESGLCFQRQRVTDFAALNALAERFQLYFNATQAHSRHGKPRFAKWMEITAAELRTTADEAALLALATREPKPCRVEGDLTVRFMGRRFRVHLVPGVTIKGQVMVHWHPFIANTAMAVTHDANGRELHLPLEEVDFDRHGFPAHAAEINAEFKRPADTEADTTRKALQRLSTGAATQAEAEKAAKRADFQPFGGTLNPYAAAETATLVPFLPRAGTPLDTAAAPVTAARTISATRAALLLRERMGDGWRAEYFEFLQRRFADGIGEDQLDALLAQWTARGARESRDAAAG